MTSLSCPACTFLNHPTMIRCEICNTLLPISTSLHREIDPVKIEFEPREQEGFLNSLKESLQDHHITENLDDTKKVISKSNSSAPIGLSGILRSIDETQSKQSKTMATAFTDLNSLMQQAAEMVKLAESLNSKLQAQRGSSTSSQLSSDDISSVQMSLVNLGLDAPAVTRDLAGAKFYTELSQELSDFLSKGDIIKQHHSLLERPEEDEGISNECISLVDAYCLYNRARGVALVSPHDMLKACEKFEELNLPYRLRRFASGLMAIESFDKSNNSLSKLLELIKMSDGMNLAELSRSYSQSTVGLVSEQLELAETQALICRDETVEGVRYYVNKFNNYVYDGIEYIKKTQSV